MAKPLSRKHAEVYESDDGFVEDAPNSKKRKSESKPKQSTSTNEGDDQIWEVREQWTQRFRVRMVLTRFSCRPDGAYKFQTSRATLWWTFANSTKRTIRCCRARR